MGCISVHIEAVKGIGNVSAKADEMKVSIGVVCDVGKQAYLKVDPDYIWLMPSNNFEDNVDVLSNVVWHAVQEE
nr:MAG TPA: hypothetical protein [Caudoviricetes sp.]